ncbi:MAG: hypothetical protein HYS77_17085 [Candidatus Rokubacteria bacterium]|nr:hypothetical protein [Candidatus Rokubacteria bacterium]
MIDVIGTWRAERQDVAKTARYLHISEEDVQAVLRYYAEYRDEVDRDLRPARQGLRLILDEHFDYVVAEELRRRGVDAVAVKGERPDRPARPLARDVRQREAGRLAPRQLHVPAADLVTYFRSEAPSPWQHKLRRRR